MKAFLVKNWAAVIFIVTALIDTNQGFLESVLDEQWQIALVRILGSLLLAWKWSPNFNPNAITDPYRTDIPKGMKV